MELHLGLEEKSNKLNMVAVDVMEVIMHKSPAIREDANHYIATDIAVIAATLKFGIEYSWRVKS